MRIFIVWISTGVKVLSTAGIDLGRAPEVEEIIIPNTTLWLWDGAQDDVEKARAYATSEDAGYHVLTLSNDVPEDQVWRKARQHTLALHKKGFI